MRCRLQTIVRMCCKQTLSDLARLQRQALLHVSASIVAVDSLGSISAKDSCETDGCLQLTVSNRLAFTKTLLQLHPCQLVGHSRPDSGRPASLELFRWLLLD